LESTSKERYDNGENSLMEAEKSLSKMEFHQILERYKAKALSNAKPTELTLIPEHASPRGALDTSTTLN